MLAIGMHLNTQYSCLGANVRVTSLLLRRSSREQNRYQVGSCYRFNVLSNSRLGILLQ